MEVICDYYNELRCELVGNTTTIRCGQNAEDLLHTAIIHVASSIVSDNSSVIIEEVKRKFHSLRIGLDYEEKARKEVITDVDLDFYAYDK